MTTLRLGDTAPDFSRRLLEEFSARRHYLRVTPQPDK